MKKSLLLSAAMLATTPLFAANVTDGDTYAPVNDIKCENAWVIDRNHNLDVFSASKIGSNNQARTCAVRNGVAYIASWAADDPEVTSTDKDGNVTVQKAGTLYKYSVETGEYLGALKLTRDGKRITGTGVSNQVGFDSFGHLWIADMSFNTNTLYDIYFVNEETGALTLAASLDKTSEGTARIDYCDIIGDLTGEKGACTVMAAASSSPIVYGWCKDQNGTDWYGYFEGVSHKEFTEFYPAMEKGNWSTGPCVKIVLGEGDEMYYGDLFYIDGASTAPTLYNSTGAIADSFASIENIKEKGLEQSHLGANGIVEFKVEGRNFIAYPIEQYTGSYGGCNVNICEVDADMSFASMTKYWMVPQSGFGTTSDGGNRYHGLNCETVTNADGSQYVNLFSFKSNNGMGLYKIGKNISGGVNDAIANDAAEITVNGNVIAVSAEASEINVYNVAGQVVATANNATEVVAPAAGVYVVKAVVAGTPVVKKVVL